jgi:hypothetical protein
MKKIIITKRQLREYIERKKNKKIFLQILKEFRLNSKNLNESISLTSANQSVIDLYIKRGLFNDEIKKMLMEYKQIDVNNKIL